MTAQGAATAAAAASASLPASQGWVLQPAEAMRHARLTAGEHVLVSARDRKGREKAITVGGGRHWAGTLHALLVWLLCLLGVHASWDPFLRIRGIPEVREPASNNVRRRTSLPIRVPHPFQVAVRGSALSLLLHLLCSP